MNYRNIIKSRELRVKILSYLGWVPDGLMLRLQYWLQTGRKLNLKNPERFTEKLQLYKMKYRNPDMLRCTDKYEVRKYIEEKGLGEYLIPLIGIYDKVEDIDFRALPPQFVAKTTDGGGGNQVLICKDKDKLSEEDFKERLEGWMSMPQMKKPSGREWAYENGYPRRILIEELIGNDICQELLDYKFFCFDGEPKFLYISDTPNHEIVFLDLEWNVLPFSRKDYKPLRVVPDRPENLSEMIETARRLSKGFPHVRVDLYDSGNHVFFGELTFYTASGYIPFTPNLADFEIGKLFSLKSMGGGKFLIVNGEVHKLYQGDDLVDYKFFCFNGKVHYVYGICDRKVGVSAQFGIYDKDFNKLDVDRCDERHQEVALPKPPYYERMVEVAERMAEGFPHVRVDLYNVMGRIYFGELTFYDGSGYMKFSPDSFDYEMGEKFMV